MTDDIDTTEPGRELGFVIDTPERAAWAVGKILGWEEEIARVKGQADRMLKNLKRELDGFRDHFDPQLKAWLEEELASRKGKKRYVDFLEGRLSIRAKPGGLRVADEAQALKWALTLPDEVAEKLVLIKTTISKRELVKVADGSTPPGCVRDEPSETLGIKGPPKGVDG